MVGIIIIVVVVVVVVVVIVMLLYFRMLSIIHITECSSRGVLLEGEQGAAINIADAKGRFMLRWGAERYAILDTRLLAELEGPKVKSPRLRAFEWRLSAVEIKRMPAAA